VAADEVDAHATNIAQRYDYEVTWTVRATCIDCDACCQHAPSVFAHRGGQVVVAQPPGPDEAAAATRALLACPVGAILGPRAPGAGFPHHLGDTAASGVFVCGYNSEDAYGGNAFLVRRASGNLLVDGPRFAAPLVRAIDAMGGVAHVLVTHADDVGDAEAWAARYGARVWIHERDRRAAPFATDVLRGDAPKAIDDGVVAIATPGHTRGSVMFLIDDDALFTGDSLYWSRAAERLSAFPDACWYSWDEQIASLERLAREHTFGWILAAHGDRRRLGGDVARAEVLALVERMRADPDGEGEY
jgi:glyoxylase-like metal-dependent hydrolase (beta-lactamase superfamily II)/ferredoxin